MMNRLLSIHYFAGQEAVVQFNFKITDWYALAPGLSTQEEWKEWAINGDVSLRQEMTFNFLPVNLSRRMSLTSKLAVQVAIHIASQHSVDFAVFVSRHGELHRTYKLLNEILDGEEASPIAFSQSVHNTSSGLFTIALGKKIPVTSLAAGSDSFQQGIVESYARLNEFDKGKILFVCFDDVAPDIYADYVGDEPFPYALGMLLERGNSYAVKSFANDSGEAGGLPQAVQFIKALVTDKTSFTIPGALCNWAWTQSV